MAHLPATVSEFGRNALREILKGGVEIAEVGVDGTTGQTNMLIMEDGRAVAEYTKEEMINVNLSDPQMRRELGF